MSLMELLGAVLPFITACVGYAMGRWHARRIHDREYSHWMNAPLQPLDKDTDE